MSLTLTIPEKSFLWPDDDTEFLSGPNSLWNKSPLGSSLTLNTTGSYASSEVGDATHTSTLDPKKKYGFVDKSTEESKERVETLGKLATKVNEKPVYEDPDGELQEKGKRSMIFTKFYAVSTLLFWNAFLIFASWWWGKFYYIFLPIVSFGVAINVIVVITLILWKLFRLIRPEKRTEVPEKAESLVLIVPCYNETEEELRKSLDSLVTQKNLEQNPLGIMIVCDGRVRGPGMSETTADCLLNTVLTEKTLCASIPKAYMGWDKHDVDIILQKGTYKGTPYMCVIKMQNSGKRDSLILVRSFVYYYNRRHLKPETILSPRLFGEMASFLLHDCKIDNVFGIVGLDADTVFEPRCIYELLKESRYPDTVGVCGVVSVDFKTNNWNIWRLMQHAAYIISQGLPRLHQSIVTHKVSCLPGCCQLIKVCEETCGDDVLRRRFGRCPKPTDSMLNHLRASYSEDRNHVCNLLTARPHVQTRQALRAVAVTDVPTSLSVFLSQRKRWSLGATVNDLFLLTSRGTQWFERIRAFSNVVTWFHDIFILGSIAGLIIAARHIPWYITTSFMAGVIIPYIYMLTLVVWFPTTMRSRFQYLAGLVIYWIIGPFLTVTILLYSLWHLNHFSWGKTRQVVFEESGSSSTLNESTKKNDEESTVGLGGPVGES